MSVYKYVLLSACKSPPPPPTHWTYLQLAKELRKLLLLCRDAQPCLEADGITEEILADVYVLPIYWPKRLAAGKLTI
jgi:hypothetical protein